MERRPFRPQPESSKQLDPEGGVAGPLGKSPPATEQTPQGGGSNSPERQPLPSVWVVLERKVRLRAPDVANLPRGDEYYHELREVNRLLDELDEKGSDRDRLTET
jgi:hypothetical protein